MSVEKKQRVDALSVVLRKSRGLLDLSEWRGLATVLRYPNSHEEAVLSSAIIPCGQRRYRLWNTMVELDQSVIQFRQKTEKELKELRRRPRKLIERLETRDKDDEILKYVKCAEEHEKSSKLSPGVQGEIWRDVSRTLPTHPFFAEEVGIGQVMLGRILSGIAGACPDVGYCQGMNYLAAAMILGRLPAEITGGIEGIPAGSEDLQANYEEKTEHVKQREGNSFVSEIINTFTADSRVLYDEDRLLAEFDVYMLIRKLELRGSKLNMVSMWQIGTPCMKLKVFQLDNIMKWAVPRLYRHFEELGFAPEILVSQWFMTLFSYTLPLNLLLRLWDYTFLTGWPGIYRVTIAMLRVMEDTMLDCNLDRLACLMRNFRTSLSNAVPDGRVLDTVLEEADKVLVTEGVLQQLQENYALEMISAAEVVVAAAEHEAEKEADEEATGAEAIARFEKSTSTFSNSLDVESKRHTSHRGSVSTRASTFGSMSPGALNRRNETNWLMRYGATLEGATAKEMLKVRDELKDMEVQIDEDKRNIQEKIVHACEVCRRAEEDFEGAKSTTRKLEEKITVLRDWYEKCMVNSGMLSKAAAEEIQLHEETYGQVPITLAEYHEEHTSPRSSSSRRSRKSRSSSLSVDSIFSGSSSKSTSSSPKQGASLARNDGSVSTLPDALVGDSDSELEEVELEVDSTLSLSLPPPQTSPLRGESSPGSASLKSVPLESPSPPSTPTGPLHLSEALQNEIVRSAKTVDRNSSSPKKREKLEASSPPASSTPGLIKYLRKSTMLSISEISESLSSSLTFITGSSDPVSVAERDLKDRLSKLGNESQKCQRSVIIINRAMNVTETRLTEAYTWLDAATTSLDEASHWKKSLCDQLQLLVEETNRRRSQKLQAVANNFLV